MSVAGTQAAVAELVRRLQAGERLEDVLRPRLSGGEEEVLRRAALTRAFDPELFAAILASPDGPTLEELVARERVEPLGGSPVRYRVVPSLVTDLQATWWPDRKLPSRPTRPPPDLATMLSRLVDYHARRGEELEVLRHLVVLDQASALERFDELYRRADEVFDLARCQDVVAAIDAPARPSLIGPELRQRLNDAIRYLRVRGEYAADFYRTARFFEPEGLEAEITAFLEEPESRAVQVVAEGGMGKTMRLRWFIARRLVPERIPVARLDFDEVDPVVAATDPWLVLLEIALQLNDQLPDTPFATLAADFGEYRPVLRRGYGLDRRTGPTAVGRPATGPDLHSIRQRAELEVPDRVRTGLAEGAADTRVVVILDTTEELVVPTERNVTGMWELLRALIDERPGFRLVLAGRYDLAARSAAFARIFPDLPVRDVRPFSDEQAEAYLRQTRGIDDEELIRSIVVKSGGRPFKLALFGDIVQQRPDLTAADVEAYSDPDLLFLIKRVLERITDPGVRWLLRYGVVPRRLTLGLAEGPLAPYLARGMAGDPTFDDPAGDPAPTERARDEAIFPTGIVQPGERPPVERLWKTLREYAGGSSWVSMEDGQSLRFQTEVVEPMRELLRGREAWTILHGAVGAWFEQRSAEDPERWGEWMAEAAYHRFQREGEAAVPWWREQLDHARALGRNDWLRRLAEEGATAARASRTAPTGQAAAGPEDAAVRDDAAAPESAVIMEFELAGVEAAEARRQREAPGDAAWATAEQRLERAVALEAGRAIIPQARLAFIRAMIASGRGEARSALEEIERGQGADPSPIDEAALATLEAEIRAGTGDPVAGTAVSAALAVLSALARTGEWAIRASVAGNVRSLAAAEARNDRIAEALEVCEQGLDIFRDPSPERTELVLLAAGLEARSGRPGAALERLGSIGLAEADRGQWLRRGLVRARAELAAGRPQEAIRSADQVLEQLDVVVPDAAASLDPLELDAAAREVRGEALGALTRHVEALDELDRARSILGPRGDAEGVCRTLVTAATIQLRGVGDLIEARQFLDGLRTSPPPTGGDAWTDGALRLAEWYAASHEPERASEIIDATARALGEEPGSPARIVRAAVGGLAFAPESEQPRRGRGLLEVLRTVQPGWLRLAFLRDVERVPALDGALPADELAELRHLGTDVEPPDSPVDEALRQLRSVEIERITGAREAAVERLAAVIPTLDRLGLAQAVAEAASAALRLDAPDLALDAARRADRSGGGGPGAPAGRASLLSGLASALIARGRLDEARAMLDEAGELIADEPRSRTSAILLVQRATLARLSGAHVEAEAHRLAAAETFRALGHPVATHDFAELSRGAPATGEQRLRVSVDLAGDGLEVAVINPSEGLHYQPSTTPLRALEPVLGRLVDPDASPERALKEVIGRLAGDRLRYGQQLGGILAGAGLATALDRPAPPVAVSIKIVHGLLASIPWELGAIRGPVPLAVDPRVASLVRELPRSEAIERVREAQAMLALATGEPLVADGILGPRTQDLLRAVQREAGVPEHGELDAATFAALRRQAVRSHDNPPGVLLVRSSFESQLASQSVGYDTAFGIDLVRLYDAAGYRVALLETPTLGSLLAYAEDPAFAIVHFAASIRLTSGGIASLEFAESRYAKRVMEGPELTASVLARALTRGGRPPLVVIDVPRPPGPSEIARQLLLRNRFAAELFGVGAASTIVATGLMAEATADSHSQLLRRLRDGESIADAAQAARRAADATELQQAGLPDGAMAAALAVFARTGEAGIGVGRMATL